jgi:hypothetical protein
MPTQSPINSVSGLQRPESNSMIIKYTGLFSVIPVLLTACATMTSPLAVSKEGISVSIHGVNYTDRPFQYVLVDPKDPGNTGGGEHIGPFSAGGIMCCYTLPKRWAPGHQVQVRATHWLAKDANGKLPEISNVYTVDIPRYIDDHAGELWVLRTKEGNIEVVSSDLQPNHPEWPGKVKGWPEPTISYQRERWELHRQLAESSVNNYVKLMSDLEHEPSKKAQESWDLDKKVSIRIDEIKDFSGPTDPAYLIHLRKRYQNGLARSKQRLQDIMENKP